MVRKSLWGRIKSAVSKVLPTRQKEPKWTRLDDVRTAREPRYESYRDASVPDTVGEWTPPDMGGVDEMAEGGDFWGTNQWSSTERGLWGDVAASDAAVNDQIAQALFHEAYFNFDYTTDQINAIRDTLDQYMMANYGIDFDSVFDWVAYRESYA